MGILSAKPDKDAASVVNHLLEVCNERASGYTKAANELNDQELKTFFIEIAAQTHGFAKQLLGFIHESEAKHLGAGVPSEAWEFWISLKGALTNGSRTAMLEACLTGEEFAITSYTKALHKQLPVDLKEIIEAQFAQIKTSYRNLKAIKHSIQST